MGFFKAYDMRGTYGADFDLATVAKIGRALPAVVRPERPGKPRWLLGRDGRESSPAVREALLRGLGAAGVEVADLGLATTPMVYFFTATDGYDGSVMITASHNPPADNGLKVSRRAALPVGYADGLDQVEAMIGTMPEVPTTAAEIRPIEDALPRYLKWQRERLADLSGLRFAIDCSNGMASLLAHELFPDAVIVNDRIDGSFPSHSPNPLKAEARSQIAALVREAHLDCGVIFDGDADRAMFVDERGAFVQPDYLIPIVAKSTMNGAKENAMVLHDVRTSRGAIEAIRSLGAEPVMVPVGHAFAKPMMRSTGAIVGGELAGHYYFREFFGCDSGVLAASRILSEIAAAKRRGLSFSAMMAPIVGKYANSGEMNFQVEDKDRAIARILASAKAKLPVEISRSTLDGIRLEYAAGWVNVRKSNTEPYLRVIIECDCAERLERWTDDLGLRELSR